MSCNQEKVITCIPVGLCKFFWTNILLNVPSIDDSSMWERSPITVQYIILKALHINIYIYTHTYAHTEPQNTSQILNCEQPTWSIGNSIPWFTCMQMENEVK